MESSWRRRVCIWEHLARHLERLAVSHTVGFLPFRLFSDYWLSFSFGCTLIFFAPNCSTFVLHFWLTILISSCLKYLTLPFLICLSFVFLLVSIILSPSVHFPCFSSIYFFFHYSISLFCTTPTLANPLQRLSETFNTAQTWVGADVTAVKKHKLQHVKTRQSTSGRYIVLFIAKWFVWCSPEPKHN